MWLLLALLIFFPQQQFAQSAEERLALALTAAPTNEQRAELLAREPHLLNSNLRKALLRQTELLQSQGDYARLLALAQFTLQVAEQSRDDIGVVRATNVIGLAHYLLLKLDAAQQHYQQAVQLAGQCNDQRGAALALRNLGLLAVRQGRLPQALDFYQRSLQAFNADNDEDQRRAQLICTTQSSLADVYYRQGDYAAAQQDYERGLAMGRQLNYAEGTAQALFGLGTLNRFLGNYDTAQRAFEEALALVRQAGLKDKEAAILNNLGATHSDRGNFRAALNCYRQSLTLKESLRDLLRLASTLNNIGLLYQYQGDDDLALDYYQRSLTAARAAQSAKLAGYALNNLGYLHGMRGRHEQALDYLQQCLAAGDPETVAQARMNIGQVYAAQEQYDEAARYFAESLQWSRAAGHRLTEARCLNLLGEVARARQDLTQALKLTEQAVQLARALESPESLRYALTDLARTRRALKQPEQARAALDEAIAQIENLRAHTAGGAREQQQSFGERIGAYQEMVALLLAQQHNAEALAYAERAKARALLDVLQSGRVNITTAMSATEQAEERRLQNELAALNAKLYRAKAAAQPTQLAQLAALQEQLKRAQLNLTEFQTQLYTAHPALQSQRGQAPVFTLAQASTLLTDAETALLEYAVTADKAFLFVITAGAPQLRVYELAASKKELNEKAAAFRQQLANHELTFKPAAAELYWLLLKPAAAELAGKTKLIVVPDARLWEVPFQALLNEAGRYLLEDFAIAYAPSLTALAAMRQTRGNRAPATQLLAFGNPALATENQPQGRLRAAATSLAPLPSAESEVKALAQLYGPQRSRVYIGVAAREERLKAEAGNARILHIAAHGVLNDANPMYSQIVLAQPAANDDGLLETWEVMKLDLRTDLAVLSACETARGRIGAGEGVIGLSWAFFIAGTPATVVSHWKVEAESTTALMREFHRHLQAGYRNSATAAPATALRAAALKLLRTPQYRHPLYWASFAAVGAAL
jgi:CHAT domain-containing protein/Tfp pilus assembly protein PilF